MRVGVLWYPRVQSPRDQWVVAFWSPMARAKYCPRRKGESISVFFVEFCCYSLIFLALENTAARFVVSSAPHTGSQIKILFINLNCPEEKESQFQHVLLCQVCCTLDQKISPIIMHFFIYFINLYSHLVL